MFTPTWGDDPSWLRCFRWVETTHYTTISVRSFLTRHIAIQLKFLLGGWKPQRGAIRILSGKVMNIDIPSGWDQTCIFLKLVCHHNCLMITCATDHRIYRLYLYRIQNMYKSVYRLYDYMYRIVVSRMYWSRDDKRVHHFFSEKLSQSGLLVCFRNCPRDFIDGAKDLPNYPHRKFLCTHTCIYIYVEDALKPPAFFRQHQVSLLHDMMRMCFLHHFHHQI